MSDDEEAAALAALLMRTALRCGPIEAVRRLTRLLHILRIVIRVITAERDRHAYGLGAYGSHRRVAELIEVSPSTMQRWMEAGRPNGSRAPLDDAERKLSGAR